VTIVKNPLAHWAGSRWIAVVGALVGAAFFVQRLAATQDSVFRAFVAACAAALAIMVVAGTLQRFWGGSRLTDASGPGGWGIRFGAKGLDATTKAVAELNHRVDDQMKTLNDRLYDLEKVVFKNGSADADTE
jgi:hypothetical protein